MSSTKLITIVIFFIGFTHTAKLPPYFKKCNVNSPDVNKCILDNANENMKTFTEGDNAYHIQSLNPLKASLLQVDVNGGLTINITDMSIDGYQETVLKDAKVDFEKKRFSFIMGNSVIYILGTYSVKGKILILPIVGSGLMNTTFVEPLGNYSFDYDLVRHHNNKLYIAPKNPKLTFDVQRAYYYLENLFNGEQRLGIEMNKFINDNWREVHGEIGVKLGEASGQLLTSILGNFFAKVPFNELFET